MLFNALEHSGMLHLVSSDGSVEVGCKLHGTFAGVVYRRKSIDERFEGEVVLVILPIGDGFAEESRLKPTEL